MDLLFYLTLGFFILLYGTLDINIDFDFFARLIVGKSFFQTNSLFNNEFYSYGTTHEFIDHEWGSSLIFYLLQNYLGDTGLFFAKSIIIFLTLFIIIKIIKLEKSDAKLHFLFFFFAIQSISYNIFSTIRCQSFSFFFFVFYLYILKYAKKNNNYKILWTLPVLNIIWANLHGGFAIGLILIFLFAVGEFLNKDKFKPYLVTLFVCLLTTLINPYGIEYIYFIFDALSLNRIHITEWQSAFFSKVFYFTLLKFKMFFISALFVFIYSIAKNIKKNGLIDFYQKIVAVERFFDSNIELPQVATPNEYEILSYVDDFIQYVDENSILVTTGEFFIHEEKNPQLKYFNEEEISFVGFINIGYAF